MTLRDPGGENHLKTQSQGKEGGRVKAGIVRETERTLDWRSGRFTSERVFIKGATGKEEAASTQKGRGKHLTYDTGGHAIQGLTFYIWFSTFRDTGRSHGTVHHLGQASWDMPPWLKLYQADHLQ